MEKLIPHFFREKFSPVEDHPFFQRRWIMAAASVFCGFVILAFYLQSGPKASAFARAERIFEKWAASPKDQALFVEMTEALKAVPQLQEKYETAFVQGCIEGGRVNQALSSASRALEIAKNEIPFHASYGETSLLIEQGLYQQSLERAVSLKEQMLRAFDLSQLLSRPSIGGAVLYAHNLLRIACLQQELGNMPGELAAWDELENLAETPLFSLVFKSFREKGVDLSDYIAGRIAAIIPFIKTRV